ncbi:hypothetical protein D3C87_78260 [compost metagenome]
MKKESIEVTAIITNKGYVEHEPKFDSPEVAFKNDKDYEIVRNLLIESSKYKSIPQSLFDSFGIDENDLKR